MPTVKTVEFDDNYEIDELSPVMLQTAVRLGIVGTSEAVLVALQQVNAAFEGHGGSDTPQEWLEAVSKMQIAELTPTVY